MINKNSWKIQKTFCSFFKCARYDVFIEVLHNKNPELIVDGPIQSDFALNREMLKNRFPFSILNGRKVNTLIFPNLDSANITYKTKVFPFG